MYDSHIVVSTVIPTRGRPTLILRAVRSALTQSFRKLEVVVALDGPDFVTLQKLAEIEDPRLRTVVLQQPDGGSAARNAGVKAASGEWIAFLDDDDEWLPEKIAKQMEAVGSSRYRFPIVSSGVIARTSCGDFQWPRK